MLLDVIASSRRRFSPLSLSPALWLDASDASTLFDATTGGSLVAADGLIARQNDKSGNAYNFSQASTSIQPTRKIEIQNGRDGVLYPGGSGHLARAGLAEINGSSSFVIVAVVWASDLSGGQADLRCIMAMEGGGASTSAFILRATNLGRLEFYIGGSTFRGALSSVGTITTAPCIVTGTYNGEIIKLYKNGAEVASAVATGATGTSTSMASGSSPQFTARSWNGYIFEQLAWTGWDTTQVSNVHSYLAAKWGITLAS
jgi:hypothetical protein